MPLKYRGDYYSEATDGADPVVCSYPFDQEEAIDAAAKHLRPGKFFFVRGRAV